MTLLDQINEDMKEAMKNRESFKLNVIRMLKGAIQLEKINKKKELSDDEIISVVNKQIKMRKDSIAEFSKANRDDLVKQNEAEIEVLTKYMPPQLSKEEVNKIIDDAFAIVNPTSMKDMGKIMKEISPKLNGKADMGQVNMLVKSRLGN